LKRDYSSFRAIHNSKSLSWQWLLAGVIIGILGFAVVSASKHRAETPYYNTQIEAASLMKEATKELAGYRVSIGIEIDPVLDPNGTGLIGPEFTELTTTLGNIEAKRTSSSPDFAALLVRFFNELGLKRGDYVAIGASGSFPSLILATLCACEVMGLEPLLVYSIGASEHGATHPSFTFVQMLQRLVEVGLLRDSLIAVSLGGNKDRASGMFFPNSLETMKEIALSSGKHFIFAENLETSIQERLELYQSYAEGLPKVFVNIGGASPNFGDSALALALENGLLTSFKVIPNTIDRGLIFEYADLGVPVIHLLNIRDLALKNGIPIDPVPLPEPGRSGVYYMDSYSLSLTLVFIALMALIIFRGKPVKRSNTPRLKP
jgi:poly-gamma-glutamate system protein